MAAIVTRRHARLSLCLALCGAGGCLSAPMAPPPPNTNVARMSGKIQQVGHKNKPPIAPYDEPLPRELAMVTMPEYVIEPPDILRIDAIRLIPPSPYKVEPLDGLAIQCLQDTETPSNLQNNLRPDRDRRHS